MSITNELVAHYTTLRQLSLAKIWQSATIRIIPTR